MIQQTITLNGVVKCVTTVPYSESTIKAMKKAGYKIKEKETADDKRRK